MYRRKSVEFDFSGAPESGKRSVAYVSCTDAVQLLALDVYIRLDAVQDVCQNARSWCNNVGWELMKRIRLFTPDGLREVFLSPQDFYMRAAFVSQRSPDRRLRGECKTPDELEECASSEQHLLVPLPVDIFHTDNEKFGNLLPVVRELSVEIDWAQIEDCIIAKEQDRSVCTTPTGLIPLQQDKGTACPFQAHVIATFAIKDT